MKNINCPICSSSKKTIISLLSSNMKIMGDSFPDTESFIVSCDSCGSVYIDTEATQEHFSKYYNSGYSKTISYYEAFGDAITNQYFDNIYNCIKKYISKNSYILDMGAGKGEFSKYLINQGYKNIIAAEPSQANCEHIQKNGIECLYDDTFSTNKNLKNKFDLIILSHALEHILNFKLALVNIKSMLSENGIIYIEVPDSTKYCDVNFPPYFFCTYEHVLHLTKASFSNLAKAYSMALLESNSYLKCNSYYVINGIFKNNELSSDVIYTQETKTAVENYLQFSKEKLFPIVQQLENSQEDLILWGIGASTAQLLNITFDNCSIVALVDSNPARQGITYKIGNNQYTIQSPNKVLEQSATIVVLPVMYKKAIIEQIKKLGFKNKVISLI